MGNVFCSSKWNPYVAKIQICKEEFNLSIKSRIVHTYITYIHNYILKAKKKRSNFIIICYALPPTLLLEQLNITMRMHYIINVHTPHMHIPVCIPTYTKNRKRTWQSSRAERKWNDMFAIWCELCWYW